MLNDPNVQLLIKTFDLQVPTQYTFHISDYELSKEGYIVIKEVIVKENGVEIRKAKLDKLFLHLSNAELL